MKSQLNHLKSSRSFSVPDIYDVLQFLDHKINRNLAPAQKYSQVRSLFLDHALVTRTRITSYMFGQTICLFPSSTLHNTIDPRWVRSLVISPPLSHGWVDYNVFGCYRGYSITLGCLLYFYLFLLVRRGMC